MCDSYRITTQNHRNLIDHYHMVLGLPTWAASLLGKKKIFWDFGAHSEILIAV